MKRYNSLEHKNRSSNATFWAINKDRSRRRDTLVVVILGEQLVMMSLLRGTGNLSDEKSQTKIWKE